MTPIPAAMSGVQLTRHGGPEALIWRDDIPVPRPSAGEVLVRVLAAGVNMTDLNTRIGWYGAIYGATHQPREVFAGLVTIINTARLRPVVSQTYPMRDIARAQSDLAAGKYPGKLVLIPSETPS